MSFPLLPNAHALWVLILTLLALVLFTREKIALESSSLFVLVALVVGFEVFPFAGLDGPIRPIGFFYGFGHEALVAVCSLMIAGQALVRTGALEPVARRLARLWKKTPGFALLLTLVVGGVLSAFLNNTPIVVLMLPMLIGAAIRSKTSTSGVLLPMGLATLVGGMSTTIGTSTNLLVVAVAADMGVQRFAMFDFLLPAMIAGGVGILYLWLIAPRLIPERQPPLIDISTRVFSGQLLIPEKSSLVGKRVSDAIKKTAGEMRIHRILRPNEHYVSPLPDVLIQAGDILLVDDTVDNLNDYKDALGAQLESDYRKETPLHVGDQQVAEVAVMAGSRLHGVRLADARLQEKYQLNLMAIHRAGDVVPFKSPGLHQRILRASDVLLVKGYSKDIAALKTGGELLVLDGTVDYPRTNKAPVALATMIGVVMLAAFGILPIAVSALMGCMVLIATGCLNWNDTTRALSAQVIMIIVVSLALGSALMKTGGADYLAMLFLSLTLGMSAPLVLASLMLVMALLTNVVSNNAAAVIGTPIAINIAMELGLPMEPFVLAVLFGANLSFATPMAYKTNLLVMNAGGYKFKDFVIVGIPLSLLMWVILSIVLSVAYKL